jgi:nicotinamidase-related amidase
VYCVRCEVLGLRARGVETCLVVDAVKAIDEAAGVRAIEEMTAAGAGVDTTADVVGRQQAAGSRQ